MNKSDRAKLLADAFTEANRKAQEERDFKNHAARVAAIAKPQVERILAEYKAESSQSMQCPNCGHVLEGWRPDPATSGTNNDDDQNEQDYAGTYDNSKLTPFQRALKSKGIDPFKED